MYLATINKRQNVLIIFFIGHVRRADLEKEHAEISELLAELRPGFRLLTDLSSLTETDRDCAPEIAKMMELCDQRGVELIVRVIPKPSLDIGLNILSLFHYPHRPRTVTCSTLEEGARALGLDRNEPPISVV
jgi:anti-anti-sigma regulatory factor